jgi:hypothetical protein
MASPYSLQVEFWTAEMVESNVDSGRLVWRKKIGNIGVEDGN